MPRRIDLTRGLEHASIISSGGRRGIEGLTPYLSRALEVCRVCDNLIKEEVAPLEKRLARAPQHLKEYIEYQIWLVEQQLTRAAVEARRRWDLIKYLDTRKKRDEELGRCREDTKHWFHNWAWTIDPREDCSIAIIPMKPFQFQEELIEWLDTLVFIERACGLLEKTRDMAASWTVTAWSIKHFLFRKYIEIFFSSRKEELVDSIGDQKSLFEKMRFELRMQPLWMIPEEFDWKRDSNYCKLLNPITGSVIAGESSNDDLGRAARPTVAFLDEFASFPRGGFAAWGAISQSSRSRIPISTPKGRLNQFSDLRHDPQYDISVFRLHWTRHEWKKQSWYKNECRTMSRALIAQELDIDYDASQPGQIFPDWRELLHVITWRQFADFYGDIALEENEGIYDESKPRIPRHWQLAMAQDVGYTDKHLWVTMWIARPGEGDPLADCIFIYRCYIAPVGATARQVANVMRKLEAPHREHDRMGMRLISHEQLGLRNTYAREHALPFEAWDTKDGYNFGIPQMKNFMEERTNKRHPFKPDVPGLGCPRIFIITNHSDTVHDPIDDRYRVLPAKNDICLEHPYIDCDFKQARLEIPMYHYPESEEGKAVAEMRPFKAKDDTIDPLRALLAKWGPEMASIPDSIKKERKLAKNIQWDTIKNENNEEMKQRLLMTREFAIMDQEEQEKETSDDWRESMWRKTEY